MKLTKFEIDGHVFESIKEARAFRANPENGYDPEYEIRTIAYGDIKELPTFTKED